VVKAFFGKVFITDFFTVKSILRKWSLILRQFLKNIFSEVFRKSLHQIIFKVKSRSGFYWNDENCAKANAFVCQLDDPTANCVAVHSARDKKTESIELDMEGFQGISLKSSGLKITNGSKNTNNRDAKRRGKNFNGGK
jgi:hypothetical protein